MRPLSRKVKIKSLDGTIKRGTIYIGKPQKTSAGKWLCKYSISHIKPEKHGFTGDDELQALSRAILFVTNLIKGSVEDGFDIWWQHPKNHGGFY